MTLTPVNLYYGDLLSHCGDASAIENSTIIVVLKPNFKSVPSYSYFRILFPNFDVLY